MNPNLKFPWTTTEVSSDCWRVASHQRAQHICGVWKMILHQLLKSRNGTKLWKLCTAEKYTILMNWHEILKLHNVSRAELSAFSKFFISNLGNQAIKWKDITRTPLIFNRNFILSRLFMYFSKKKHLANIR